MKNSFNIGYLTKEGFHNLYTNRLMSIASISVLFSCLVIIGVAFMALVNIGAVIDNLDAQNVIVVFLKDDASEEQVKQTGESISALANVTECEFQPKKEAFEKQLEKMGASAELYRYLQDNPLPDAYQVTVRDMALFDQTVTELESLPFVQRTRENRDLAAQLAKMRSTVTWVSGGIILLLLLVSLFIISNTIRITLFSRRLEISIMKSVGATNSFIRWPFTIEGVLLGIVAGCLSLFAVWGIYALMLRSMSFLNSTLLKGTGLVSFGTYAPLLLTAFLAVGAFTGIFGSVFSMRKYLKEKEFVEIEL